MTNFFVMKKSTDSAVLGMDTNLLGHGNRITIESEIQSDGKLVIKVRYKESCGRVLGSVRMEKTYLQAEFKTFASLKLS